MFRSNNKNNDQRSVGCPQSPTCTNSCMWASRCLSGRPPSPSTEEEPGGESREQGRTRLVGEPAGAPHTWSEPRALRVPPQKRHSSSLRASASTVFIKSCIYTISEYVWFDLKEWPLFISSWLTQHVSTNPHGRPRYAMTGKQEQITKDRTVLTSPLVSPFSFCWQRLITSNNKGPPTVPSASIIPKSRAKFSRPSRPWNWERNKM